MNLLEELSLSSESTVLDAMKKISQNGRGICFVTNKERVIGSITDGDIRRFLIKKNDIMSKAIEAMRSDFFYLSVGAKPSEIRNCFKKNLKSIPLLDKDGKLVDIADAYTNHLIPIIKPSLKGKELEYITDCISTNWVSSQGKFVQIFENLFSELHDDRPTISVSNGTTALHLALVALGIGEGDEVLIPDITFAASANAVMHCNAKPVLCEIEKESLCIDIDKASKMLTTRTKAIMPVHLYGQACDMLKVMRFAKEHNLRVLEDCAEGLGTKWESKRVGTFGDAAAFSFFGNKTITTGEGGMIIFKDRATCSLAKELRDHGMSPKKKYWHEKVGYNYRMTNMQAALGVAQLERLDEIVEAKKMIGMRYINMLSGCDEIELLPKTNSRVENSFWLFTIILKDKINKGFIIESMKNVGIEVRPVFYPLHMMPPYKNCKRPDKLDKSEWASKNGLSLPSSVDLTESEQLYICERLLQLLKK